MKLTNAFFDLTRNIGLYYFSYSDIEHILILKNHIVQEKNVDDRVNNDFKEYKFETDFIDPLEEFSFRENCFTDHWLFLLTHSPSFANLKVIDLRGNNIKSLLCLKVNHEEIYAPMLEELYIDTIVSKDEIYNISFLFEILSLKFEYLNVLWVEAYQYNLYWEKEGRKCHEVDTEVDNSISKSNSDNVTWKYKFRKLFLSGIDFINMFGQIILIGLKNCEELTIKRCKFDVLDEPNPFMNLNSLKSLSIIESDNVFDVLHKVDNLHKSLQTLKLNAVKSTNIIDVIKMFKYLKHLRIANYDFEENKVEFETGMLPKYLKKFEMIKWNIPTQVMQNICMYNFWRVSELVLLDNKF